MLTGRDAGVKCAICTHLAAIVPTAVQEVDPFRSVGTTSFVGQCAVSERVSDPSQSLSMIVEHLAASHADLQPVGLQAAEDSEDVRLGVILH